MGRIEVIQYEEESLIAYCWLGIIQASYQITCNFAVFNPHCSEITHGDYGIRDYVGLNIRSMSW